MATQNSRDVELRISATASGDEQIRTLAQQIAALAKEGGSAAPEFQALAKELDKIAAQDAAVRNLEKLETQVAATSSRLDSAKAQVTQLGAAFEAQKQKTDEFRVAQEQARDSVAGTEARLRSAKAELNTFKAEQDQASRATVGYKDELSKLRKTVADLENELANNKAQVAAKSELRALEAETRKAERAYAAAAKEAKSFEGTLGAQQTEVTSARDSLKALGIATESLSAAQATVLNSLLQTSTAFTKAAEAQRNYQSITEAVAAANARAADAAKAAATDRETAARRAANAEAQAAAEAGAAALRLKLSQEELAASARKTGTEIQSAFDKLNLRSADAIRADIDGIRAALKTLGDSGALSAGQFEAALAAAKVKTADLQRELQGLPATVKESNAAFGLLRQSLSQFTAAFGAFEAGRAFIEANNNVETLRRSMTLLTGTTQGASEQIKFLRETANNAGLSVGMLSKDFVNFTAALQTSGISLDRQREVFGAVTNAAGQLGISTDRVGLILQAFAQTANKGKVTLEELQGQLGESLPGALSIVANGLGVTKERLLELVKSGIDADTFFAAFTKGASLAFGDGQKKVESFAASWNRLKNAFDEFSTKAADTGAFKALVGAIDALAANFGAVAKAATVAAEAFALFKIAEYIRGWVGLSDATKIAKVEQDLHTASVVRSAEAKAVDTLATKANTAAVVENTTANAANKAAWIAVAADLGKVGPVKQEVAKQSGVLATALGVASAAVGVFGTAARGLLALVGGLPGVFALVALNARELGTAIADQIAKWTGLKAKLEENEKKLRDQEQASKDAAAATRRLADEAAIAKLRFGGLNDEAIKLVGEFDKVVKQTGSASEAFQKLQKDLRFDNLAGITAAGQALGELALRGKITGDEIKAAFATAFDGKDLKVFELNARTAFSGLRDETTLLNNLLTALADESLKRVGSSVRELETGFSKTLNTAINNTDTLRETLTRLGASSEQTGMLLSKSLNKEVEAATTSKSIEEVIRRITEVGAASQLTGVALGNTFNSAIQKSLEFARTETEVRKIETALKDIIRANPELANSFAATTEAIKKKLTEVSPVLKQLKADAELLGVTLGSSSDKGIEQSMRAYERLKASGKASTGEVIEAFGNLAKKATEAAGGIIPEWVKVEAATRGVSLETLGLIKTTQSYINSTANGLGAVVSEYERVAQAAEKAAEAERKRRNVDKEGFTLGSDGQRMSMEVPTWLSTYNSARSQGASEDQARNIAASFIGEGNRVRMDNVRNSNNRAGVGDGGTLSTAIAQAISELAASGQLGKTAQELNPQRTPSPAPGQQPPPAPAPAGAYTVNVNFGGSTTTVNTASQADAQRLTTLLQSIGQAAVRSGP